MQPVFDGDESRASSSQMIRICTGGDDQALTISHLLLDSRQATSSVFGVQVDTLLSASGSALKGVGVQDQSLWAVGYDQRLSSFELPSVHPSAELLYQQFGISEKRDDIVQYGSNSYLKWTACAMTDVSDVAGLALSYQNGVPCGVVFGQGVQLFD